MSPKDNLFLKDNVVKIMKNIVPEYISKNSEFAKFDQPAKKEHNAFEVKIEDLTTN